MAVLVLSPKGLAAFKAARANQLRRSINISMGSALATISLTVPSVLVISMFTGREVALELGTLDIMLLLVPDRADAILARGLEFGESRMIINVHWQSDVDAGRLMGAAAVARLQANEEFRHAMEMARHGVARIRANAKR